MTRIRSLIAGATAALLGAMVAPSPAFATSATEIENLSTIVSAPAPGFTPVTDQVPAVESLVGRGARLSTDPAAVIPLGSVSDSQQAALVRITVLEPETDVTVLTRGDVPVHLARAGSTSSTTVLLPLHGGAISLWGSAAAELRIEPLAAFTASDASPGATLALAEPVVRADTAQHLGGARLGADPMWIGLVGEGGVSSTLARSIYLTLDVELERADTLTLGDGQTLDLPAGRSIVTTVVDVDDQGGITAALAADQTAALRATVTGWVVNTGEDAANANLSGSYVVATEQREPQAVELRAGDAPREIEVADHDDIDYALVLVGADDPSGGETTTLAWGADLAGRASGEAVDRAAGAQPQLALVPVTEGMAQLSIRRGSVDALVQPLGGFLGEPVTYDAQDPVSIQITAPTHLSVLDVSESGYFELSGVVTAGANAIDRIEISSPQAGVIGTALIDAQDDRITWSMRLLAPEDGSYEYRATVFERSDPATGRASDTVALTLDVPDADDTVVNPDVRVYRADENVAMRLVDDTLIFSERPDVEPGDLVVSAPRDGVPDGFLARVSHLDQVGGEWVVSTTEAGLEDVLFQADVEVAHDYDEGQGIEIDETLASAADPLDAVSGDFSLVDESGAVVTEIPVTDATIVDPALDADADTDSGSGSGSGSSGASLLAGTQVADGTFAEVRTGDEVDLTLSKDEFALEDGDDFTLACRTENDGQEPTPDQIDDDGHWASSPGEAPDSGASSCTQRLQGSGFDVSAKWTVKVDTAFIAVFDSKKGAHIKTAGARLDPWEFEKWSEKEGVVGASLAVRATGEISIGFTFALKVSMKLSWKPSNMKPKVEKFITRFDFTEKAAAQVALSAEAKGRLNTKLTVASVAMPTFVFPLGILPIAVSNRVNFAVAVTGEAKGSVSIPAVGIERHDILGAEYENGKKVPIKNDAPTKTVLPTFEQAYDNAAISLSGKIAVGPEAEFISRIYTFAGPNLTLGLQAGVDVEAKLTNAKLEVKGNLFLAIGLNASLKLTLIKWNLINFTVFDLGIRVNLVQITWSREFGEAESTGG